MNENKGIIETMQGQLASLTSNVAALRIEVVALGGNGTPVTAPTGGSTVDQEMQKEIDRSNTTVELDKNGVPWDESIHAATHTKTAKDLWKRKNGVTAADYDRIGAELKAKLTTSAPAAGNAGFPAVDGAPTPGMPSPGAPTVENTDKTGAMSSIAILTDEFEINYETVLTELENEYSVKSFDELPVDQYPAANQLFTAWVNEFRQCDEEVEKIITMGGDNGQGGITTIFTQHNITSLNATNHAGLRPVHEALIKYREQWDAYVAGKA